MWRRVCLFRSTCGSSWRSTTSWSRWRLTSRGEGAGPSPALCLTTYACPLHSSSMPISLRVASMPLHPSSYPSSSSDPIYGCGTVVIRRDREQAGELQNKEIQLKAVTAQFAEMQIKARSSDMHAPPPSYRQGCCCFIDVLQKSIPLLVQWTATPRLEHSELPAFV